MALYLEGCRADSLPAGIPGPDRYRGQPFPSDFSETSSMSSGGWVALLRREHRGIVRQIGAVGRAVDAGGPRSGRRLSESITELGSRLEAHFSHEEAAIYRQLESTLKEDSPTQELFRDHRTIQGAFRRLGEMGAEGAPAEELKAQLASLRGALTGHIEKEERVVFWLAESRL